jgi:tRNA(adenine34) deaminase
LWDNLSAPWQIALEMAWEAYCDNCIPIGAVTTDGDGKILSRGRNRIYSKRSPDGRRRGMTLAHAEVEALSKVDYEAVEPHACSLYTTTEPCPMCLGTFYMSGFRTVQYASRDPYAGSIDLLGTTPYLRRKPILVKGSFSPALEIVLMALYIEYDLVTGRERLRQTALYSIWQQAEPRGIAFGEKLYQDGELRKRRSSLSAAQAFEWLLEMVELFI